MNRYFGLLKSISREYNIQKGKKEAEESWKARLIYTFLGQSGCASLFDIQEDLKPASIIHFKKRIDSLLDSILSMYPEMEGIFINGDSSLSEEIYNVLTNAGCIYHEPKRLTPSTRKISHGKYCIFLRGQALNEKRYISGMGCFQPIETVQEKNAYSFEEMFALQDRTLCSTWEYLTKKAKFGIISSSYYSVYDFEYLRVGPPYKKGYWSDTKDTTGNISLARSSIPKNSGSFTYYLYKIVSSDMFVSQLPNWMTENHNYRTVAVACLASRNKLPSTKFHIDGGIVTIQIGYLYPPSELHLIKLYSWPTVYSELPHDFNRTMDLRVFEDIRNSLEKIGYQFEEV